MEYETGAGVKILTVSIHNFRSVINATFAAHDFTLLVGANNAGKSSIINALRVFYEDIKWTGDDWPKVGADGEEAWVEITFQLSANEHAELPEKYKRADMRLAVRKYLRSTEKAKANQSNIYAFLPDGVLEDTLFFGAKNISQAKLGSVVYIPALSVPGDHLKTSGPSPLRDILTFIFKKMVSSSPAYANLQTAFAALNDEAKAAGGLLSTLATPMNEAIAQWGVSIELDVRSVAAEDFAKTLIQHSFSDLALGQNSMGLDKFGHGFQRTVIYELIRLAPTFQEGAPEPKKKEFSPEFTLILFEEPEAFLHPDQQVNMALGLRSLGKSADLQVIATSHSSTFLGKSSHDLTQIIRVCKTAGISHVHQLSAEALQSLFGEGSRLAAALQTFVDDPNVAELRKKRARDNLAALPAPEIAEAEERFRYQLWLDSDRAGLFFASKVIVCEGPSERALFTYLLEGDWMDLRSERISIIDALGKFNIHRYLALLDAFAIPHAVIMDGDAGKDLHGAINDMIESMCDGPRAICAPHIFLTDLEDFLGLQKPLGVRKDKKPINILKAASEGAIPAGKLNELRAIFKAICGVA